MKLCDLDCSLFIFGVVFCCFALIYLFTFFLIARDTQYALERRLESEMQRYHDKLTALTAEQRAAMEKATALQSQVCYNLLLQFSKKKLTKK